LRNQNVTWPNGHVEAPNNNGESKMAAKKTVKRKTAKTTKAKTTIKASGNGDGYKGHREGSTKGKVHQMYDKLGPAKARVAVTKAKMCKPNTLSGWFSEFKKAAAGQKG
jgi:hypothetical protein